MCVYCYLYSIVCYLPLNESLPNPKAHDFQNRNAHSSILYKIQICKQWTQTYNIIKQVSCNVGIM